MAYRLRSCLTRLQFLGSGKAYDSYKKPGAVYVMFGFFHDRDYRELSSDFKNSKMLAYFLRSSLSNLAGKANFGCMTYLFGGIKSVK